MDNDTARPGSILNPLREGFFLALVIANIISMIGWFIHEVGAAWLMTSLAPTPFMVAMVSTAITMPFFLLSLPAGAIADILDRRRVILGAQIFMVIISLGLGIITSLGLTTPFILLVFTFLLSLGAAVNGPAWHAIIPELVKKNDLPSAVAIGSVSFNIARAVGPVIGGLVVVVMGPSGAFYLNAISFLGVIIAITKWQHPHRVSTLPEERFFSAMRTGIRYVRHAPEVRSALIHTTYFTLFGSTTWAFLPIIARQEAGLGSLGFGILIGFFGVGAILSAPFIPFLRRTMSLNTTVFMANTLFSLMLMILAFSRNYSYLCMAMIIGGIAWLVHLSSLIASIQSIIPSWVRGRVMSVHMLFFFGALSGGSALAGIVAASIGIPATIAGSSVLLILFSFLCVRYKLTTGEGLDLTPAIDWPATILQVEPNSGEGPVLIVTEYEINPENATHFRNVMASQKKIRRRDGAIRWNLFHDIGSPGHYIESYIVDSWGELLRQQERLTVSDREIEEKVLSCHIGSKPPRKMHFLAEQPKNESPFS